MSTIWIVGAGIEAVAGIKRAKEMGLKVIASDGDYEAPGFEYADQYFVISTYDIETHRRAVRLEHPDGVICMACDVPQTVAFMARSIGKPNIGVSKAYLSANKLAQRMCLQSGGIPVPKAGGVASVVIKPVDSRGARGVFYVSRAEDFAKYYQMAMEYSKCHQVMVEEFLRGPQISTETVVTDDGAVTCGFSDRNYDFDATAPYMIENGGTQPSLLSTEDQRSICDLVERAVRVLGWNNCTVKGDVVFTPDGPKIIELAARLSGGYFATHQIPMSTGVDLVGIAIRLALGEHVDLQEAVPKFHKPVAIRYEMPSGITDHTQRGKHCIGTGETREAAIAAAEAGVRSE